MMNDINHILTDNKQKTLFFIFFESFLCFMCNYM